MYAIGKAMPQSVRETSKGGLAVTPTGYEDEEGDTERRRRMTVKANLFPGGVRRALTMSYDDGQIFDVRLAELFDKYHIRGHLSY